MNVILALISRNFTQGRGPFKKPEGVIIHTYNGKGRNLQGWFNNPIAQVSATASVVDNGDIYQYLDDMDTAWANGNWDANQRYLSLEHWDNAVPSDSARTDELYEASAQWIASKYIKWGWDIENQGLIKPHKEFADTGCPGGLSIERIRNRVTEILHPAPPPPLPDWRDDATDLGLLTFKPEADYNLYNIDTGEVDRTYKANSEVTIRYALDGYRITPYSFNNRIKKGFKLNELEYKEPIPDIIVYFTKIKNQEEVPIEYQSESAAKLEFENRRPTIYIGEELWLIKSNKTTGIDTILETYKGEKEKPAPIPDPIPQPDPQDNVIVIVLNFIRKIINLLKGKNNG